MKKPKMDTVILV